MDGKDDVNDADRFKGGKRREARDAGWPAVRSSPARHDGAL